MKILNRFFHLQCLFDRLAPSPFYVLNKTLAHSASSEESLLNNFGNNACPFLKEIISLLLLSGVTPAGSTQRYYIGGGQENRKDRKTRKSKSEIKWMVLAQPPFPARKREAVTQGGTMEPGG